MSDRRNEENTKRALAAVLGEAREDLGRADLRVNWESVDEQLFLRVAAEKKTVRHLEVHDGSPRAWRGIGALAAAAALLFVFGHRAELSRTTGDGRDDLDRSRRSAGALASREGRGDIRVTARDERAGTEVVEPGRPLAVGGRIETNDASGIFVTERAPSANAVAAVAPAVTWALETQTRVDVLRAPSSLSGEGSPLILGLLSGAIEAQVAPVSLGEAFAIDVDGVRIAVHGTHLRVARAVNATRVTIDLSEGVVSIGLPPRAGATYGTLVSAPAHVEFDAADFAHTMSVDHAVGSVRAPHVLAPAPAKAETRVAFEPPHGTEKSSAVHADPAISPGHAEVVAPHVDAEKAVLAGVKACAASSLRAASVKVTVSSKLALRIGDDGSVQYARFDPPLAPEARDCASRVIYGAKFDHPGSVELSIEIEP